EKRLMTPTILRLAMILVVLITAGSCLRVAAQTKEDGINLLLSTLPPGKDPQRYPGYVEPKYKDFTARSLYITMRDGIRIAVTVVLPKDLPAGTKIPTLMRMTRYWRAQQDQDPIASVCGMFGGRFFCAQGYAMVVVDARGTGVSFGVWRAPFAQDEIK